VSSQELHEVFAEIFQHEGLNVSEEDLAELEEVDLDVVAPNVVIPSILSENFFGLIKDSEHAGVVWLCDCIRGHVWAEEVEALSVLLLLEFVSSTSFVLGTLEHTIILGFDRSWLAIFESSEAVGRTFLAGQVVAFGFAHFIRTSEGFNGFQSLCSKSWVIALT